MTLEAALSTYGYWALWLGTFLEGETILVLGGLAAQQGYLTLPGVVLSAFAGSLMGDQCFFFLGRRHSGYFLNRFPRLNQRINAAQGKMQRYETLMILFFRFIYGIRTVTPFMYGMSPVRASKFAFLNAVGALIWAMTVASGGFYFGHAIELFLGRIRHIEILLILGLTASGILIGLRHLYNKRSATLPSQESSGKPEKL